MDKKVDWKIPSLIALVAAISILIILAIIWHVIANKFNAIFLEFGIEIPLLTQFGVSGFRIFFAILVLLLCAKEFLKNKKLTFIINIAIIILLPVCFIVIGIISLFLPLFKIAELGTQAQ